jgi:hypothetical protein
MARSISKISKELEKLTDDMKKAAKEYGTASGKEREEMVKKLKEMTKKKKDLEHELERGVMDLDQDVDLQIDEVRKMIRNVIREELKKRATLNEIEFEKEPAKSDVSKDDATDEIPSELNKYADDFAKQVSDELSEGTLNESVTAGIIGVILASPVILKMIGWLLNKVAKYTKYSAEERAEIDAYNKQVAAMIKQGNMDFEPMDDFSEMGKRSKEVAEKIHHAFVKPFKGILKGVKAVAKRIPTDKSQKVYKYLSDDRKIEHIADIFYAIVMVTYGGWHLWHSVQHITGLSSLADIGLTSAKTVNTVSGGAESIGALANDARGITSLLNILGNAKDI